MSIKIMIWCLALLFYSGVSGQEIDLNEFATTLSLADIPVRVPPSHFKFNKDRTPSSISKRIIGGDVATAHEYPFQAALYVYVQVTLYFCGGSLITPEWVLTAAHCTEDATSIIVILGSHDLSVDEGSRVVYNSTTYVMHADWDSAKLRNDIALIRLPRNVTLNTYINTVSIAFGSDSYIGFTSRCLGWGRTVLGSSSNVLRYVDAEVITNEICSSYEDYQPYIVDHHLCTSGVNGGNNVGSCNGDSGGPLVVNGIQVGIVSFGHQDCALGLPSVYTRLTDFYTWVNQTIENYDIQNSDGDGSGNAPEIRVFSSVGLSVVLINIIIGNYL